MKLIDVVNLAQAQGHIVKYRKRSDGGIIVTSLDGLDFKDLTTGNKMLREVTGVQMSEKQRSQREAINRPLRISPNATKKQIEKAKEAAKVRKHTVKGSNRLDDELNKELKKTQRIWNKNVHVKDSGRISAKKVKHILKEESREAAFASLRKAQSYAKGLAYPENVLHLITRIERSIMLDLKSIQRREDISEFLDTAISLGESVQSLIRLKMNNFKEEWIQVINELIYDAVNIVKIAASDEDKIKILGETLNKIRSVIQ